MEFIKDIADAWSQRIRSPIIGSIGLSFAFLNWKPLWYLIFAERPVRQKFLYFDQNTDWLSLLVLPIAVGLAVAFLMPWVKFFGAYTAKMPLSLLRQIQHDSTHEQMIYELKKEAESVQAQADVEAAREQAKIDAAKRLEEAKSVGGDGLEEDIKESRTEQTPPIDIYSELDALSEIDLGLMVLLNSDKRGKYSWDQSVSGEHQIAFPSARYTFKGRQQYLLAKSSISNLEKQGFLDGKEKAITEKGYAAIEAIFSSSSYDHKALAINLRNQLFEQ